jgi:hypothetical protein
VIELFQIVPDYTNEVTTMSENKPDYTHNPVNDNLGISGHGNMQHGKKGRDPIGGLLPGLILILLGVLFFLASRGTISWNIWWQYLLIGLGIIFLLDSLAHYLNPALRSSAFGRLIPGIILFFIGIAFIYGWSQWWPLALIAAGIIIIISVVFRK